MRPRRISYLREDNTKLVMYRGLYYKPKYFKCMMLSSTSSPATQKSTEDNVIMRLGRRASYSCYLTKPQMRASNWITCISFSWLLNPQVYIAPMKALVQEKLRDWTQRFSYLGVKCQELTSDSGPSNVQDMLCTDIILTTPEVKISFSFLSSRRDWPQSDLYLLSSIFESFARCLDCESCWFCQLQCSSEIWYPYSTTTWPWRNVFLRRHFSCIDRWSPSP